MQNANYWTSFFFLATYACMIHVSWTAHAQIIMLTHYVLAYAKTSFMNKLFSGNSDHIVVDTWRYDHVTNK